MMENRIKEKELLAVRMGWDKIDLSGRGLLEVPEEEVYWFRQPKEPGSVEEGAKDLASVLVIDFSHNRLARIPGDEFWFRTDKLQLLCVDYNELEALPRGLADCRDLISVSAQQNRLFGPTVLGAENPFALLPKLVHLDLSGNHLAKWPEDGLGAVPSLEVLKLANNRLTTVPGPRAGTLLGLRELDLSQNRIHTLGSDDGIGLLTNLHTLNLSGNELESLPEDLGKIGASLLRLDLSHNSLRWLPSTLGELDELRALRLGSNALPMLPESIRGLRALVELDASRNDLALVPPGFGNLLNLEIVNLSSNALRTLPDTVGLLTRLQDLDLHESFMKAVWSTYVAEQKERFKQV